MIGILTVGLILLITVQLMMEFDKTKIYLNWVESQVGEFFGPELEQVAVVSTNDYVVIELLNPGEYSTARVLVNNDRAFYFQRRLVKVPVTNDDLLIIDTRGIDKALWFEVIDFSKNVTSLEKGQQFRVKDGLKVIDIKKHEIKY